MSKPQEVKALQVGRWEHTAVNKSTFQASVTFPASRGHWSSPGLMSPNGHWHDTHAWSRDVIYLLFPVRGRIDEDIQETGSLPVVQADLQGAAQLLRRPHEKPSASERRHDLIVACVREEGHRWGSDKQSGISFLTFWLIVACKAVRGCANSFIVFIISSFFFI